MKATGNTQFPEFECIHHLFEQQAARTPHATALEFAGQQYSYEQLDQRSNQLAHQLLQLGLRPQSLVAICLERSTEMIIGLLGILKAGAAYVPIDPHYPQERIAFMLEDSAAEILLTQQHLNEKFPEKDQLQRLNLDTDWTQIASQPTAPPTQETTADQLIYTIYTSGSTGKPKGVQVEHHSVANLVAGQIQLLQQPVGRFLYAYSFAFDGAVLLIWWTLLDGGTLVIAPEELEKDVKKMTTFLAAQKITHLLTFPSVYSILLQEAEAGQLATLQSVSVAGEACPAAMVKRHHQLLPGVRLLNQYGPTEATVGATIYITPSDFDASKVPIGKAIDNVQVYVLDEQGQPVAPGQSGEIYIGGRGVARGYLNRPELTQQRFFPNPFSDDPTDRLYRTGDLARLLDNGLLDFIGRVDHQVKLRGYRIELGEVEAALGLHPSLREVCVLLRGESAADKKLVAYLIDSGGRQPDISELRSFLGQSLPEYMIPAAYVFLRQMPLTPAGKIDRKALPEPDDQRPELAQSYAVPTTTLQTYLAQLWSEILHISPIGIHDKFFELGGNSLQAGKLINRLQKELGENIFIVSIFETPTIAGYAAMLERDYAAAINRKFGMASTADNSNIPQRLTKEAFDQFEAYVPASDLKNETKTKNPPAIFLLAPPRSGTTLLRVMLAGHPDIFAANELQLLGFETLTQRKEAYSGKFSLWLEGAVRTVMELQNCDADQAKALIEDYEQKGYSTQQFYQLLQNWVSPGLLLDKSPSYVLDPLLLQKAEQDFEGALYIHLQRHPYAMIRSFERMHMDQAMYLHAHPYNARQLGELIWTCSHRNALDFLKTIPQHRQFSLQYEELVRQPKATMERLCTTLGLAYHPALINPYENIDQKMTDGLYADSKPMGDVRLLAHKKIDPSLADAWKGVQKDNFLSTPTWQLAEALGYENLDTAQTKQQKTAGEIKDTDIAIIGMSGRFPGAENVQVFWQNLIEGRDVSREFSEEELLAAGLDPETINDPDYVRRGMPLKDHDCFDASFFGYNPREAALMDPQHRIFLECAYAALEDANYNPEHYSGRIGVFGGVARNTYLVNNVITHPNYFKSLEDFTRGITQEKDFPATRVAYKLNLSGPAVNVQTACSSSGVAVHLACQSLLMGDSDMVLVGGGRIQPPLTAGHLHTEGHALSPDGYCRAFDADADGMVRGNGMAFIVLKKQAAAERDGDHIYALIKGTAINNDGSNKIGYTAPSVTGQAEAIRLAYERAGINPATVGYIEAHGTGTRIGDPIEIAGLSKAFAAFTDQKQFCAIGSVKTNIGHLDAGACVAGIIKTALALQNEQLPQSLHFKAPNPQIQLPQTPFYVNDQLRPWPRGAQARRAGVSSFGLGGTNAHIVLEEAPRVEKSTAAPQSEQLVVLSAKTAEVLEAMSLNLGHFLENNKAADLAEVAWSLQLGRQPYVHRQFMVAKDQAAAVEALQKGDRRRLVRGESKTSPEGIVFMFPGGGAQHANMGLGLYQQEAVFREAVDQCLKILRTQHDLELYDILYPKQEEPQSTPIQHPLHAICLLFTIEYASAQLWMSWGLRPTELIGHSLGEYTAACIAGVFSLEDALAMVCKRGELFQTLPEGAMLSIPLPESEVQPFMDDQLSFAAINKPDHSVVSGAITAIDRIKKKLTEAEIHATRLHISVAAHSLMVEPILAEFGQFLQGISFQKPTLPIVSNLSGDWVEEDTIQRPDYWLRHLRHTVRFSDGIAQILQLDNRLLLEVGPGQTLSTFARQHPARRSGQPIVASLRHPKEQIPDRAFLLKSLGQLWLAGLPIDWKAVNAAAPQRRTPLPTYPFARERHWIGAKAIPLNGTDHSKKSIVTMSRKTYLIGEIKEVFHQLSGIPQSEMDDHATFLELGFDSLFLTQVTAKIKKKLNIKLSFRQLFEEAPTLAALADYADQQLPEEAFQAELAQANPTANGQASNGQTTTAPQALPAPPQPVSTPPPAPLNSNPLNPAQLSNLEAIVHQQLQIMQQQLNLLQGGSYVPAPASQPLPPLSSNGHSHPKAASNGQHRAGQNGAAKKKSTKQPSAPLKNGVQAKGFGPWRPIDKKGKDGLTDQQRKALQQLIEAYTTRTKGSQQLTQRQRPHLADPRAITGFNKLWKDMIYQIAVERSKGAKLWDVDGNEYIDYRMAFGISLFGHTPDFVQQALREQLEKGFELGVLTPLAQKVADLLCELSGMERATFVNTGSEAISAAVRAARTATGKDKIAYFEEDYHGIADEMLARGIKVNGKTKPVPVAPGIPQFIVDNVLVLKYDEADLMEQLRTHADELAAIIIEPVQPNNPHKQRRELLHQIRQLTAEQDIAMIFDEMITGFRVAPRGAQEWYGIDVDIVAYGKIISGGLPMAAVAGKSRYMDCFDGGMWSYGDDSIPEAGVTFFGGTFVKHPLSLASAYAALSEIKRQGPPLYDELNAKTARLAERIKALFLQTKAPMRVRSTASIIAMQPIDNNPLAPLFFFYLRLKGIHITAKAALVSTAHTEEDLNRTYEAIEETIREMQTAGFFQLTLSEVEDQNIIVYPPRLGEHRAATLATAEATAAAAKTNIPLTEGQKEVWVEQQLGQEAAAAYNLSSDIGLSGELQLDKLQEALQQLVARHEALRTRFNREETTQEVLSQLELEVPLIDLSGMSKEERDERFRQLREEETTLPLDIFTGPLIRARIIRLATDQHHLLMSVHHGIADGWSCGILANDLAKLYTALCRRQPHQLAPPKQISTYALEQEQALQSEERAEAVSFWGDLFADSVPVLEMPTDHSRPPVKTYDAAFEKIALDAELYESLRQLSAAQGTTLFITLYAAFQTFLYRLSGQEDFVLGLVAAGQMTAGNQNLVAHSVNLLPIRMQLEPEQPFSKHLKAARGRVLDAFEHQNYTLGALVKQLNLPRDVSRQPIISILFNMDADMGELEFDQLGVHLNPIPRKYETFDIFINIKPTAKGVDIEWTYNTDLFEATTIRRRLQELQTLLRSIVAQPDQQLARLPLLPVSEKRLLLEEWTNTKADYPNRICIHEYFERMAAERPKRLAAWYEGRQLSYEQLNRQANRLAHLLRFRGVQKGDFVGIYMDRSLDLLVGLLAILKAGGVYVPLDPSNPKDRLQVIIEDAEAEVLLTHEALMDSLPVDGGGEGPVVVCLEQEESQLRALPDQNPNTPMTSKDRAYVIYTSGSTGKPKGVVIPHYAVLDHHFAVMDAIDFEEDDVVLSVASVSFDPSVQDFFMPLFKGAAVAIASQEAKMDGYLLMETIRNSKATVMQATPATWRMLLTVGWEGDSELMMISIGEALTTTLSRQLLSRGRELWNAYGPTETTIYSTYKKIEARSEGDTTSGYEPVGPALKNVALYILDRFQQPVPIGVAGEIYVGGVGVAPGGYFKRPALSQEKFVPHPLNPNGGTLYRTGDLGRYLENGDVEFLGRADFQVKIRGYRIELGEIEALIAQYPGVSGNVVIVREDKEDDKRLVAYLTMKASYPLELQAIRTYLKEKLPDYMVPAAFVVMEEFPLTATLKINRKALPIPDYTREELETGYMAPQTPTEQLLTEIWNKLLSVGKIGINDNFFELGGHSLIAVKMMAQIEKACGKKLPLASLLENATIRRMAGLLDSGGEAQVSSDSLVAIKASGSKVPIYLVHGAGLHVLMFQTLAAHMDPDQPIYALQARGLNGEAEPLDRIEAIAAHYISEIITQNPLGPYALAGYSFGGLVAFEMAKQLREQGREVAMLGVFDTVVREHITGQKNSYYQQLSNMGKKMAWNLALLAKDPIANLKYKSNTLSRRFRRWTWSLTHDEKAELKKTKTDHAALVDRMNHLAFDNYKITPYDGAIHLFRARERRFYVSDFEYLGWKPFAEGGIIIHDVPGDHLHLFNPPHGEEFARILQQCLDQLPVNQCRLKLVSPNGNSNGKPMRF
ncbi:MAG: amino acid adenylation domain-containing protein [Bacteroidota bacterium]